MSKTGFTYGGIHSSTFYFTANRETHHILPAQEEYVTTIPLRDGVVDFGIGGYGRKIISFDIFFEGNYTWLRKNTDLIMAWLSNNGTTKKLSFDDEPNRYYEAKIIGELNMQNTSDHRIGRLEFFCNPPWAFYNKILQTPDEILWTTAKNDGTVFYQNFSTSGGMRFTVPGSRDILPVITIIGYLHEDFTLTYKTPEENIYIVLGFTSGPIAWDGVRIDARNETVTLMSSGENFYNQMKYPDPFAALKSGRAELYASNIVGTFPKNLSVFVDVGGG